MSRRMPLLLPGLALLAGCGAAVGGSGNGTLNTALTGANAPYAVLDLATRSFTYRAEIADLATNAAYRGNSLVFKRVQSGSQDVLVAVFELTQAQWQTIDGTTPWVGVTATLVPTPAGDLPASNVDYATAIAALAACSLHDGARLDLPTAAEWTSACGATTGWSWGSTTTLAQLRAAAVVYETADGLVGGQAVGSHAANPGGFYDMHGNVWEWTKPGTEIRGGSWHDSYWLSRSEAAPGAGEGLDSTVPHALIGLRLVLRP